MTRRESGLFVAFATGECRDEVISAGEVKASHPIERKCDLIPVLRAGVERDASDHPALGVHFLLPFEFQGQA